MHLKDFITRQRVAIAVVGAIILIVSLSVAHRLGPQTLPGEFGVDLASASIIIVFTAFVVDYLAVREAQAKTQNSADLADTEITILCLRIKRQLARLFSIQRLNLDRSKVSTPEDVRTFLETISKAADEYLATHDIQSEKTPLDFDYFSIYSQRLEDLQANLEQIMVLYEYALAVTLKEQLLSLRNELQVSIQIFSFVDYDKQDNPLQDTSSLIRGASNGLYEAVTSVVNH